MMSVNFDQFDESAVVILKELVKHFPKATEIGFNDLFPEYEGVINKRTSHIGVLGVLRHELYLIHM